jgi:hypothetical protein
MKRSSTSQIDSSRSRTSAMTSGIGGGAASLITKRMRGALLVRTPVLPPRRGDVFPIPQFVKGSRPFCREKSRQAAACVQPDAHAIELSLTRRCVVQPALESACGIARSGQGPWAVPQIVGCYIDLRNSMDVGVTQSKRNKNALISFLSIRPENSAAASAFVSA